MAVKPPIDHEALRNAKKALLDACLHLERVEDDPDGAIDHAAFQIGRARGLIEQILVVER
jgi:hypothetical protein